MCDVRELLRQALASENRTHPLRMAVRACALVADFAVNVI